MMDYYNGFEKEIILYELVDDSWLEDMHAWNKF